MKPNLKDGLYNMAFKVQEGKYEYKVISEKEVNIELPFYYKEPDGDVDFKGNYTKFYKIIKINKNKYMEISLCGPNSGHYSIYSTFIDYDEFYHIINHIYREDVKVNYKKLSSEKEFNVRYSKIMKKLIDSVELY